MIRFSLIILAGVILTAAACTGSTREANSSGGVSENPDPSAPIQIPGVLFSTIVTNAPPTQNRLLQDGYISLAEYEQAKLSEMQCLRDAGLEVVGNTTLDGLYRYRFDVQAPPDLAGGTPGIMQACSDQYSSVIDRIWAEVSVPLLNGVIDESRRLMAECYARNGLDPKTIYNRSSSPDTLATHQECLRQMWVALRIDGVSYGVDGDGRTK